MYICLIFFSCIFLSSWDQWHGRFVISPALFLPLSEIVATMGGCISVHSGKSRVHRKYFRKYGKRRGKISALIHNVPRKRLNDGGIGDFAVSHEFVHLDFEKGAATTCKRSEVTNKNFHVTQMQWNHSQIDSNGMEIT